MHANLLYWVERNGWDPIKQFNDRLQTLNRNGRDGNKIELLILGGTLGFTPWDIEKISYINYSTLPILITIKIKEVLTHLKTKNYLMKLNGPTCGITIETRPDQINAKNIKHYRKCGVTRVQLGVQQMIIF